MTSISSELVNLEDALSVNNTYGKPLNAFVGVNCGSKIFTIHMSLFDLIQYTEVANDRSLNSNGVAQRPLNLKHATAIAKYMLKGLLNSVYQKRIKHGASTEGPLAEIMHAMGKQKYYALGPIVASFRNCTPNGTNLKVNRLTTDAGETAAFRFYLNQGDVLWIVDGQHRRKAAEMVVEFLREISTTHKYPTKSPLYTTKSKEVMEAEERAVWNECLEQSKYCTITIDTHLGLDIEQEQQLFFDLNNYVKSVDKSLGLQFDGSNPINRFIKYVLEEDVFEEHNFHVNPKDKSDWSDTGLSRKELASINAILFLNRTNINNALAIDVNPREDGAKQFWETVVSLPSMNDKDSRSITVAAQPVVIKGMAKVFFDLFYSKGADGSLDRVNLFLDKLKTIDFSHNNPMWRYYTLSDHEREQAGLAGLSEYLPSDDEGKNRDLGAYDIFAGTFRFGAKHNDIYPIIGDMIRWKLGLSNRRK